MTRPYHVRLAMVLAGFAMMGTGIVALKRSELGLGPWDVLHDGIGALLDVDLGLVGIALGVPILLLWLPLRLRPNLGTVLNVVCIGLVIHYELPYTSPASAPWLQVALLVAGILLFAVGQGLYLAPDLGAGPRDGLMTGIHHRYGVSLRAARTGIELAVLALGMALGGTAGVGTLAFALAIGPLVQTTMAWFGWRSSVAAEELAEPIGLSGE